MQGIRGATTVEKNDKETIMEAVQELLTILTNDNDLTRLFQQRRQEEWVGI